MTSIKTLSSSHTSLNVIDPSVSFDNFFFFNFDTSIIIQHLTMSNVNVNVYLERQKKIEINH